MIENMKCSIKSKLPSNSSWLNIVVGQMKFFSIKLRDLYPKKKPTNEKEKYPIESSETPSLRGRRHPVHPFKSNEI